MNILFTDLDNTLIYSKKTDIAEKVPVELYNGEINSFMSKYSYELLHKLNEKILIVPITTRTYIQYSRIELGIIPKYVLCANGGILLKDGIKSDEWYKESLDIVKPSSDEREKAYAFLQKDKRRKFECRNIDDLFIFTKCYETEDVVRDLKAILDMTKVEALYNKDKLYIMPKNLNKADTIKRFIREYATEKVQIFAAGDTEFDTGMIELADIGFAHKDLNISKNIFNDYEGLFSDFYLERVLEYIKE
nr:HAD hydrolase family protein [uncultured Lachnoanaerobaculum sp.]